MDLSGLSTADLQAIQKGDMSSVSTAGLKVIAGAHKAQSYDSLGDGTMVPTGSPEAREAQLPTSGMSGLAKFGAGYGKAGADLLQGVGQMLGLSSRQDVADRRARDAPLMADSAGRWGNLAGSVADTLPAALVPGANTMAGAGALGAGIGLMQPSTSTGETLANTGMGGAAGPLSLLAGRAVGAVAKGTKAALIDPFTAKGQQGIAQNLFQTFAGGDQSAAAAAGRLSNAPQVLPGVAPTTAELADNAGLAQLQKTLSSNPSLMDMFTQRAQGNRAAMTGALDGMAQTPAARDAAVAARSGAVAPLYKAAESVTVPADAELGSLLSRPSMSKAWDRAQALAAERGETLAQPNANDISGKTIQYLKMGLNDLADTGPQNGMGAHERNAVNSTLSDLNKWTTKNVPELRQADAAYAQHSAPINQMDVGQQLSQKLQPALTDFGQNTRLSANNYANALRNGDALASKVTGIGGMSLSDILTKSQMTTVKQIGEQLARTANAAEIGAPKGSPTAQNLISQNVLSQFLGPLGLPQGAAGRFAASTIGRTLALPGKLAYMAAEPDVMKLLGNASLDPKLAQQFLTGIANKPSRVGQALWKRQGLLGPLGGDVGRGLLGDSAQQ